MSAVVNAAPAARPASSKRMPATRGPPNSAETAENEPAVASTVRPGSGTFALSTTIMPTTDPRAISGASGPSTAPKTNVPVAASATLGPYCQGTGFALSPPSGLWPPSPGMNRRASHTTKAPTMGSPITRYHGGEVSPMASGRSVQSQPCNRLHERQEQRCHERRRAPR